MRSAIPFAILATLTLVMAPAAPARADTVADLIARNTLAHGGAAALAKVKTLRLTGKLEFGGGGFHVEVGFGLAQKRPGRVRTEATIQGLTQVQAYDGARGWQVQPFEGRHDPERMSADDAKDLVQQAEIDPPLVAARARGDKIELLGREDVDGTRAFKLRVTRKDGDVEYVYLDPDSMLEIRVTTVREVRGVQHVVETDFGAYARVGGVWMAFSMDSGEHGKPRQVKITVERAEVNVALPDTLFRFPAAGTKAGRAIVAGPPSKGAGPSVVAPPEPATRPVFDSGTISGLGARNIGSAAMSGRVAAVAAVADGGKTTVYVGSASGGLWRSFDGGTTFTPVFDREPVQSIGAIAIDPRHHETVWAGTGESWTRNTVSAGNGIYKSTDAGETWARMGLPESERIVRILVSPRDGNVVYACVPGKLWSDSPDRGVYKTTDGGRHWSLILRGKNLSTGCSGLTMDPKNPEVLIAGMWDFRRKGWTFRSGGDGPDAPSGSGMYCSGDGGKHWRTLSARTSKGLPSGPWGRVEVEYAPSSGKVVYALIESKDSALYRSADGGRTWEQRDKSQMMVWRPFYFGRLVVDPTNPDRVFKPDLNLVVSEDGGKSFAQTGGGSHGDWHDLWIDPHNPKHIIGGDDGGLWISHDGGNRWWKADNLPISQFYHVSVDDQDPYNVYGGLQDNAVWTAPSEYPGGISNSQWENLYNGDGFWAVVDPTDPDYVYTEAQGGYIGRVNRKTLSARDIQPTAGFHEKLRFNWNTPIAVSPTRKNTLYIAAQFLFRSRDHGSTWQRISPDLTTNDPAKQKQEESGGITIDNSEAEMHTTIFSISESPRNANVIWAGTDDGNLQLTRNGGRTWTNVVGHVTGLPPSSWVSWVEASRFAPGTAYAAFDRHTFGDMTPWVYKTTDYGKSWTRIVSPAQGVRGWAHVIREDVVDRNLLFLGTERGLWISIDGGRAWAEFRGGAFPRVPVRDLAIQARERDLVIATHGRGIWIIDDISPLRALTPKSLQTRTAFLPGRPIQERMPASGGWPGGDAKFVGDNPPGGAPITYYLRGRHIYGDIKLEILDPHGKVVDTVTPTKHRGINRVSWAMAVKPPKVPRAAQAAFGAAQGPRIVPGVYTARLTNGGDVVETRLKIVLDRRATYSVADRKAQFDAVMKAHKLFGDMSALVDRIDAIREATEARAAGLPANDALGKQLRAAVAALDEVKRKIVATKEGGAITGEERIREHLATVYSALMSYEGRPARYQVARVEVLRRELAEVGKDLDGVIAKDLQPLAPQLQQRKLDPIPIAAAARPARLDADEVRCIASAGADCAPEDGVAAENDR
jgi:photosystem II stability/assembly factor-like uncharacterized protein